MAMSIGYLLLAYIIEKHHNKLRLILFSLTTLIHTSNLLLLIGALFKLMHKNKINFFFFSVLGCSIYKCI